MAIQITKTDGVIIETGDWSPRFLETFGVRTLKEIGKKENFDDDGTWAWCTKGAGLCASVQADPEMYWGEHAFRVFTDGEAKRETREGSRLYDVEEVRGATWVLVAQWPSYYIEHIPLCTLIYLKGVTEEDVLRHFEDTSSGKWWY